MHPPVADGVDGPALEAAVGSVFPSEFRELVEVYGADGTIANAGGNQTAFFAGEFIRWLGEQEPFGQGLRDEEVPDG